MPRISFVIAGVVAGTMLVATGGHAQEGVTYDVKVVCGKGDGRVVAPGQYWTAINVLNPGEETVRVEAQVATALPAFEMGPLSQPEGAELRPNRAFEIDCPTLMEIARAEDFLKGFAVVRGSGPLTIVAVYTQADPDGRAVSIHTERVPSRAAPGCPDLRVREIREPTWDADNRRSVIDTVIENVGTADAPATLARLIDPSTTQPTGAPYNSVANTPPLTAGGPPATVTFELPYWVFNPDAELEVTADYKKTLEECDETNNSAEFFRLG